MRVTARTGAVALALVLAVSGCGGAMVKPSESTGTSPTATSSLSTSMAMARPGAFRPPLASPDIQIQSQQPLAPGLVRRIDNVKGVSRIEQFSTATFYNEETAVTYAAVDPETFRAFTPGPTASLNEVWDRVADGEIALRPDLKQSLAVPGDYIALGNDDDAQKAHIGAYAPLVDRSKIGAVLNEKWADRLGMPKDNALLVSTGRADPAAVLTKLKKLVGRGATVTLLAPNLDLSVPQTAVLTGGSVAQAVGSFTYTANKNGTVNPEARWVNEYIRTESVPILGNVTCNKGMLPSLRNALTRVVQAGLASKIHVGEYGGCYVPRFIANDPSRGLSFHTFGTAIDLNVPGNLRGTVGQIDRRVVNIFIQCGFNWGGTWHYTDPMHFELARITNC